MIPSGYCVCDFIDPFEEHVGPLCFKEHAGQLCFAFEAQPHHCNSSGFLHGGMLMTFADFALCLAATWGLPNESAVTVSFNCELTAPGRSGDFVESVAEVVARTGSLTFVRGQIYVADRTLMNYSGIVKRVSTPSSIGT